MSARIDGTAYGRRATLEVDGTTLRWRAQRGIPLAAENLVTTIHDVKDVHALAQRWTSTVPIISLVGAALFASHHVWQAIVAWVIAAGIAAWRYTHPRHVLAIELSGHELVLAVDAASAGDARMLADRIRRCLASGEQPDSPPTLP